MAAVSPGEMDGFSGSRKDPIETGYQMIQSLYSLGAGGLFGMGLGESRQKYLYIPYPETDFIFAIIGEELGFIGGVILFYFCYTNLERPEDCYYGTGSVWMPAGFRYYRDDCYSDYN